MSPNEDFEWLVANHPLTLLREIIDKILSLLSEMAEIADIHEANLLREKATLATKVLNVDETESKLKELKVAFKNFLAVIQSKN